MPELPLRHPWERAVNTVVEETPPLVDNAYHRIAGDRPPNMIRSPQDDLLDYWEQKLYGPSGGTEPDPAALAELYHRAGKDDFISLLHALRTRRRERDHALPADQLPPEGEEEMPDAASAQPHPDSY